MKYQMGLVEMIVDEYVLVNPIRQSHYYEELGYEIPKYYNKDKKKMVIKRGTKIYVKVKDLSEKSNVLVNVKCDICGLVLKVRYSNYTRYYDKEYGYSCTKCKEKKKNMKIDKGDITPNKGENGYWRLKSTRVEALEDHIETYGTIDGVSVLNTALYLAARKYDGCIPSLVRDSRYDILEITNNLVDDRGDMNKSYGEMYVANFLIESGLKDKYQRDVIINELYGKYNSDFKLLTSTNQDVRIEVWGFSKQRKDDIAISYNKIREKKELLYKSQNIKLISFEQEDFKRPSDQIKINIYNKLSPWITLNYQQLEWFNIKSYLGYTEREILTMLLSHSSDETLPSKKELRKTSEGVSLLNFLYNNGMGLNYFSKKFKIRPNFRRNYWNENTILKGFKELVSEDIGLILYSKKELEKIIKNKNNQELKGLMGACKNNGVTYWKVKFLINHYNNGEIIYGKTKELLNKILTNPRIARHVTKDTFIIYDSFITKEETDEESIINY